MYSSIFMMYVLLEVDNRLVVVVLLCNVEGWCHVNIISVYKE